MVLAFHHGRDSIDPRASVQTRPLLAVQLERYLDEDFLMGGDADMKIKSAAAALFALATLSLPGSPSAGVSPGDTITKDQADKVADLVSPGNLILVKQGMTMKVVPAGRLEWPPPYKSATEKYSPQVRLAPDGTLKGYAAGLPVPLGDANDPNAALE